MNQFLFKEPQKDTGKSQGKVERVARAICKAAGSSVHKVQCVMCDHGKCMLWTSFRDEARAAIKAIDDK